MFKKTFNKYIGTFYLGYLARRKSREANLEMARQTRLAALEDFCPVGERFNYLGVFWVCTSHTWAQQSEGTTQGIVGEHLTLSGDLIARRFYSCELPILIAENNRYLALTEGTTEVSE